ncbi:MAG: phytanoyl-CoA dioxygenase family protein [Planctomycetes bacterium]|nr:phytanoyl-CoA dioxygenase family protein [Planctomycetota bacterium]MCB9920023.1 phytanoyl-CoA dioxygenase family protein [Planctomycetota bacterium]
MERAVSSFECDGYAIVRDVVAIEECPRLSELAKSALREGRMRRSLLAHAWCRELARRLATHDMLKMLIPASHVAVQCTFFEKSRDYNWLVKMHQDLSIPVAERVDDEGLGPWSVKDGSLFVRPPADVLAQLIAVRVHLDPCTERDGPLRVVPGSHRFGRLTPESSIALRQDGQELACTMAAGSALVMHPLLLHASSKADGDGQRRVLHFLFGPRALPHGLQWPTCGDVNGNA